MNNFVKILSSQLKNAVREIKILRYGKSDVQTPSEILPYGLDSNPIKDMIAMYAPTDQKGETAIIGYINKNQKAGIGEFRTFCTDANGIEKFYTWMKVDGTFEIGGTTNWAVKFNELKIEFNKLKDDHNTLANKWNTFCTAYVPGSPTVVGLPPTLATSTVIANNSNIDNAKNDKIKTI